MVHNKEMLETQEYIESVLKETDLYKKISVGEKVEGVTNDQKKRHVHAKRRDGKEFLYIVNSDPMVDKHFMRKIGSATSMGLYTMPIFYKNRASDGEKVFMKWFEGSFRNSLGYMPEEKRRKIVETKKNERTALRLMNGRIPYFNSTKPGIEVKSFKFGLEGDYRGNPNVYVDSRELKTAAIPKDEYSVERFIENEYENYLRGTKVLYALPRNLDRFHSKVEEAEELLEEGRNFEASEVYNEIKNSREFMTGGRLPYYKRIKKIGKSRKEGKMDDYDQMSLFD